MKKQLHFSVLLVIVLAAASIRLNAQTIRRVNNTAGLNDPNVYSTIQAAHNAAVAGDIISLEPSENPTYVGATITKTLHFVGPGYFLDKNPNTFFDKRNPEIMGDNWTPETGALVFENGSQNSTIKSLKIKFLTIQSEGILIERCHLANLNVFGSYIQINSTYSYGNNCTLRKSFVGGLSFRGNLSSYSNWTITNNIIGSISTEGQDNRGLFSSTINYNTFGGLVGKLFNSTVTNCIFDSRNYQQTMVVNGNGTSISNCVSIGSTSLPEGTGNINGANPTTFFVNGGNPFVYFMYPWGEDAVFQLSQNSPAKTAAAGGGEAGAFGNGVNAYRLSGLPASPIITNFTNTGSGTNTTPLTITISVRSNN